VSKTFHARDLFSPVAAHLAAGAHFDDLGDEVDPATLVRIELPEAHVSDGELIASIVDVDRFGNMELNVSSAEIDELGLTPGDRVELRVALTPYYAVTAQTYADASRGELILYEGSYGYWAVAINGGSAATLTESSAGDDVRIRPAAT
jgi:S-adenosyl-L-methionine hydrolase (adenosine-forming)